MSESTSSSTSPSWLEKLQMESWQAELIISGVAIFGVFQAEEVVFNSISWMVFHLPPNLEDFHYFTIVYLSMAFSGLQVFFLIHFILRAFWVALLGVASVYPHGLRDDHEHDLFAPSYLKAWKTDFPDLQGYAKQLDQVCSMQLSAAFSIAMVGGAFAIWIILGGLAYYFLAGIIPEKVLFVLGAVFVSVIALYSFGTMLFWGTSLKHSKLAERYNYPMNRFFSKVMFSVFYRPVNYVTGTIQTNTSSKKVAINAFLIPVLLSVFILIKLIPTVRNLPINQEQYFELDTEANQLRTRNYADQYPDDFYVISPIMPSAYWQRDQYFEFFVPMLTRERTPLLADCSEAEVPEEVEGNRRFQVHERRLACYKAGFEFRINGQIVDPSVKFQKYPLNNERGIWCHIADPPFKEGENLLTITHHWRNEDGERKVDNIPFYYQPWGKE